MGPHSTQPSSKDSSPRFNQNGFNWGSSKQSSDQPCLVNRQILDMTGSRLVQFCICVAVTGASWRPSTKQTISAGDGVNGGSSGSGSLLMASAFPCLPVGLKEITYSYMAKANTHLCILPYAWDGTPLCSLKSKRRGL